AELLNPTAGGRFPLSNSYTHSGRFTNVDIIAVGCTAAYHSNGAKRNIPITITNCTETEL
ncbi:MAG: hypothetical protein IJ299_01085, partial [Oscillospiraceae bacterium]|nr:hypothetical protein [Oscillospiraceae bacterium]